MKKLLALLALLLPVSAFAQPYAWDVGSGTGTVPTASAQCLWAVVTPASAAQCLAIGTNLSITGGTLNAASGGSPAFSSVTGGTNTSAAMLVGTGASLGVTGSGTLNANEINGATAPASAPVLASNSSSQLTALTLGGNLGIVGTVLGTSQLQDKQTGTSYTICAVAPCSSGNFYPSGTTNPTDAGTLVSSNNASAVAWTLPQATTTGFGAGFSFDAQNIGSGTLTITPTTSTINGSSSLSIPQNKGCTVTSDGTNYNVSACTALLSTGGGNVSNSGTPSQYQVAAWVNSTTIEGIGPGTSGQALVSGGGSAYPSYSSTLPDVTSVNSTTIPSGATLLTSGGALGTPSSGSAANLTGLPFSSIATATNTAATMTVGTGASLTTSGSGTISATAAPFSGVTGGTNTNALTIGTGGSLTVSGSGTNNATSLAGVTPNALQLSILGAGTTFTIAGTGCTPSAHSGTAFAGAFTLASGPCTAVTITMNGATGFTTTNGYHCSVGDKTTQNAGTWVPVWGESASNTTTATLPIPGAAGATDVITFGCTPY